MPRRLALLLCLACLAPAPPADAAPAPVHTPAQAQADAADPPGPDPAVVAALRDADRAVQERLAARLAVIPGLEKARVEVSGGVATLRGLAADDARRQLAATIAGQTQDVVLVENRLELDTDVRTRSAPVFAAAAERLRNLVAALPLLLVAAAIVLAAWWLGRWLSLRPGLQRRMRRNPFLVDLARQAIRIGALLAGLVLALDLLDAGALVGALLGTAGVVGIAVGFAFRDVAENYIAGILLSLRQPFAPHDHVVIDGHEGKVAALTSRATILVTLDGNHLRLPNALVFKGVMLNYSRNPRRQFAFEAGIANDASVSRAQRVAREALARIDGILDDPAPAVLVAALGESTTNLRISAWIDQGDTSFAAARSEAIRLVKRAFQEHGIDMPDPGYRIELRQAAPEPEATGATPPARPAPPAPHAEPEAEASADLRAEHHIDRQIDRDHAATAGNLLDPDAPRE
ncbi:mechanosensitive ion channel [Luteimonas sp. SJ-92]|uniref:Small-conductance mechanosensitive channel n=1 Tax=Luteimonas salinisoli TaxID=2752307 RepID=A0A853JCV2_9GAMM|nr:mechanosensitive ion channel family protein [Luteimonas salinisoli]NZA27091.1 mechanosensitive ion channel [Luteimonas salinisoli]